MFNDGGYTNQWEKLLTSYSSWVKTWMERLRMLGLVDFVTLSSNGSTVVAGGYRDDGIRLRHCNRVFRLSYYFLLVWW